MFQFHNGTIKTIENENSSELEVSFNSITVQLRQFQVRDRNKAYGRFNSITVQLRRYAERTETPIYWFQFHNGTIKTLFYKVVSRLTHMFQFHNGTIKTIFLK